MLNILATITVNTSTGVQEGALAALFMHWKHIIHSFNKHRGSGTTPTAGRDRAGFPGLYSCHAPRATPQQRSHGRDRPRDSVRFPAQGATVGQEEVRSPDLEEVHLSALPLRSRVRPNFLSFPGSR